MFVTFETVGFSDSKVIFLSFFQLFLRLSCVEGVLRSPLELVKGYTDDGKEPELSGLLKAAIPDLYRRTVEGAKEILKAAAATGAALNSKYPDGLCLSKDCIDAFAHRSGLPVLLVCFIVPRCRQSRERAL